MRGRAGYPDRAFDPSSVRFAATFSRKGRRKGPTTLDANVNTPSVHLFTGGSLARLRLGFRPDPSNLIRVMPAKGGNAFGAFNPSAHRLKRARPGLLIA